MNRTHIRAIASLLSLLSFAGLSLSRAEADDVSEGVDTKGEEGKGSAAAVLLRKEDFPAKCESTRAHAVVVFDPAGAALCAPQSIAEGAKITAVVIVPAPPGGQGDGSEQYRVTFAPGEAIASRIHGDYGAIRSGVEKFAVKGETTCASGAVQPPAGFTCFEVEHAPISAKDVAISVVSGSNGVDAKTTFPISQKFALGIVGVMAVTAKSRSSFGVADGIVIENTDKLPLSYFVAAEFPLVPWRSRYYDERFQCAGDRLSWVAGIGVPAPRESVALGLSVRLFSAVSFALLWTPHKREVLPSATKVGDMTADETIAVGKRWDLADFGAALTLDSAALERLASLVE